MLYNVGATLAIAFLSGHVSIFADDPQANVAGSDRLQFPSHVLVLDYQSHEAPSGTLRSLSSRSSRFCTLV
jgi:hypothetical protein